LMSERFPAALIRNARFWRLAFEVAVVIRTKLVLREHGFRNRGHHLLSMISDDSRINRRIEWDRISQMVSVIRTVGRVQIDRQMWIPTIEQANHRLSLG